jgi:hypothetical protein
MCMVGEVDGGGRHGGFVGNKMRRTMRFGLGGVPGWGVWTPLCLWVGVGAFVRFVVIYFEGGIRSFIR